MTDQIAHEDWSSRLAFILVSIGTTVGLGNPWRFPFAVGESGAGSRSGETGNEEARNA